MKFFTNLKLTQKISLLSVIFFIFLALLGGTSIKQIYKVNSQIMELNNLRMVPIIKLENLKSDVESIRTISSSLMGTTDSDSRKTIKDKVAAKVTDLDRELAKYKSDAEFKTLLDNYSKFKTAESTFLESAGQQKFGGEKPKAQGQVKGDSTASNYDTAKTNLIASFDKIIAKHVAAANQTYNESKKVFITTLIELISLLVISAIVTLILCILLTKGIVSPIKKVTSKLKEISENNGDLTQRIGYNSKDEVGELSNNFDLFMDKLHTIIKEVSVSATTISSLSSQLAVATTYNVQSLEGISNTVSEIVASTSDGAAITEETTASLTEASKFSQSTFDATKNTALNSKKANKEAEQGAEKITEIVSSIENIAVSSKEVSNIITGLDASSKKIGDIIAIITGISEQTNMLALNAAIEAARAGEAGKGFSVVADQIRTLADESSSAATQIANLVKDNQLKTVSAVNSVHQVEEKVSNGVIKASEVGESIKNIISNIQDIVNQISQIEDANEQQERSSKEIESAISNIAVSSNEIASGTENISASIEKQLSTMTEIEKSTSELSKMSEKLIKMTSGFIV